MTAQSMRPRVTFTVPFHVASISEEEVEAVVETMRSGWLTTGPRCQAFETAFAAMIGEGAHAVSLSSGTAALHLALEAVGVGPGDLVVVPDYTFTATAAVVRHLGAEVVLADVDPVSGNLSAADVSEAVAGLPVADRERVRAVVPVHFAGLPCDLTALSGMARQHDWAVVDDAAHALPCEHRGRAIGLGTDAAAFSFYATKPLCTGEGGMLVTTCESTVERVRSMRLHGIDRDVFARYVQADAWRYEVVAHGFKANMTDLAAAIGIVQLRRQDAMHAQRRRVASAYHEAFRELEGVGLPPQAPPGDKHAHHLYPLRVLAGRGVRDALVRELAADGIGTSVHFIPLHMHRAHADARRGTDLPGATRLFEQEISLPLFPDMTPAQIEHVVVSLPRALRRAASSG